MLIQREIRLIYSAISCSFGVSELDINSDRRDRITVEARHWGMYITRKQYAWSFPKIGRMFGDRDHKTAWSAVNKMEKLVSKYPEYAETYLILMENYDKIRTSN